MEKVTQFILHPRYFELFSVVVTGPCGIGEGNGGASIPTPKTMAH